MVERREQQTTRLYITLLVLILIILLFYITFNKQSNNYTINRPTQTIYENLYMKYADTLECPCTNISITYENFISIHQRYHQICSTGFISPFFIDQLYEFNKTNILRIDFMSMSAGYFQWISSFCILSQIVIYNLYTSFQTQLFVNPKLLSQNIFNKQTDDIIQSFISTVPSTFVRALTEMLKITASAQLLSASYTSFDLRVTSNGSIQIDPTGFSNCSCLLDPLTCSTDAGFYSYGLANNTYTLLWTVKGIRVACLPYTSFLQSNLDCWYSIDCYQQVRCIFLVYR